MRSESIMNIFHLGKGKVTTLHELFLDQLRDLYSAETQLTKALPEMAEAANDATLKQGFETHLEETKGHVRRLEQIFSALGEKPTGKTCQAMEGLIKEGKETINEDATPEVKDAALIAAGQRVEHYEIAGYGTVRTYAELMGHSDAASLLQQTLDEEDETNKKLTAAAEALNVRVPLGHRKGEPVSSLAQSS
ncbi:MAG TPA: ferritin-like domain-containing protein [Candidatus Methylacidiphilales bacterium]|nr:ferritin-like domain-containing protein [Candidatus Methylacidiphilales bacterium]